MGLEILFFVLVAIVAGAVERARRRKSVDRDLDGWAEHLGMVRVGNELFGRMDEIPVGARLAFDAPEGAKRQARWTMYARIQPPLDLGLAVCTRGYNMVLPGGGIHIASTGDARFYGRFRTGADEPARAQALLSPQVRQLTSTRIHPKAMFLMTDGAVAVQTFRNWMDDDQMQASLHAVAAIAEAVNRARDRVSAAAPLVNHRRAWGRFAADNGLSGISAPLCMFGVIEDAAVYAYSIRKVPMTYCLEIWMRFESPLGLGLLVQPMRTLDRFKDMFGTLDYKLGDELFDETFLVRISDEDGTVDLLDADTRKRLLVIHDTVGPVSLTDDGISVRLPHVPPDPAIVPTIVRQMIDIASFIADKRGRYVHGGPYR